VSGSAPFNGVNVAVGNVQGGGPVVSADSISIGNTRAAAATNPTNFFRINLPSAVTSQTILITFGRTISASSFDVQFQLIAANGTVGTTFTLPVTVHSVSATALQISLSWNTVADLDLHVIEPGNNEIFFGATVSSTSGGTLDLDSNPDCATDNIDNENVGWPTGKTPAVGNYTVRVDEFASCGVANTNFVVTVTNNGSVSTFTGSFTSANADSGFTGSGRTITTFNHSASSTAPSLSHLFDHPSVPNARKLQLVKNRQLGIGDR
jgi:hypothetical protein